MKKFLSLVILVFVLLAFNTVKASTCPFGEELALGSKDESVGILQSFMLNTLKIYNGPITNFYGPLTMASVKVFQDNSGLLQTGKVDLVTATALCKVYMSYKTSEPITDQGSECFIKTLGIQKGYFEEANEEVKQLQIYLNQKGFYPENVISGYFGVKTETALKAFQTKNNISPSGIVDDVTFKAICGYESNQSSYCPFVTENLTVGYFENETNEVKMLQMILNKLSLLEEKNITGYFGNLTKEAVKTMQTKSGLSSTGILNLETRQALCKMLNLPLQNDSNSNPYESADSKVDLTITGVSVLPEKIDVNTKTAIVIKVKNIGSEGSTSVKGSLYMNDKEITKANISTIASGEEVVGIVKNWTCEQKGIYALKIFIDSENGLVEKNKYNNVLVLPINCGSVDQKDYKYSCNATTKKCEVNNTDGKLLLSECQKQCVADSELPDLTITKFSADKTFLKPNEVATITIIEKNIGKSVADYHKAKLTVNDKGEEADWAPLEAGSSNTFNQIKFTCTTPGFYNLKIETDSSNAIKELSETNNSSTLELKCADANGNVPVGDSGNSNTGGSNGENNGGSTGGGKVSENQSHVRSGALDLSWFSVTPNDCYNAPLKRCGGNDGKTQKCGNFGVKSLINKYGESVVIDCTNNACVDKLGNSLPFYRESPHEMRVTYNIYNYNNLYKPNAVTNCEIDLGDGTKHDCSFTGFGYNGKDRTGENNSLVEFYHKFTNSTNKPVSYCPIINISDPVNGDKMSNKLTNQFGDGFCDGGKEDSTKCVTIYPEGWAFQSKDKEGNDKAYYVTTLTASPNPGKVDDTVTFSYEISGITETGKAWCKLYYGDKQEEVFECSKRGSKTHVYKSPDDFKAWMTADESIDFLGCPKKELTVSIKLAGSNGGGKDNPPKDKYDCVNNKCVVTSGGKYDNDTCDGKCVKAETPPPTDDKNDIGLVCEVKQTAKPLPEAVSVEMIGKIKNTKGCKAFQYFFGDNPGSTSNVLLISLIDKDPKKTTIDVNMKLKAVCKTDSKIVGSTVCKTSFKKDQSEPEEPEKTDNTINTTASWFDGLLKSIFGNKNTEVQTNSLNTINLQATKKYTCASGVCKESSTGDTLEKCMSGCLKTTNAFPSLNLTPTQNTNSNSQNFNTSNLFNFDSLNLNSSNTTAQSTSGYNCDISLGYCVPVSKGAFYTSEKTCNLNCTSSFSTSSLFNLNTLNLTTTTAVTKYKCSNGACVKANNLDTNTYTDKNCNNQCTSASFNSTNLNSTNSNMNFNVNFNQ